MISLGIQGGSATKASEVLESGRHPSSEALQVLMTRLQAIVGARIRVLEPIAIGGMATIFRLQHLQNGAFYVAKVLREDLSRRPEVIESFRREAMHAARLGGHPNAIPVFDSGMAGGLFFLTMPFVEGEDLDKLLESQGPLSRDEALHAVAQISSLLCHADSHGITHCDISPGNIRLDTFGRYRLMDFGISHAHEESDYHPLGGTPLYSSPEVLRGETPDARADIYSVGLVLCEMLSGKPLFEATTIDELRGKHLRGEWRLPLSIQDDRLLSKLLQAMLARDRDQRMSSPFELSGALAALGFERPEFRGRPLQNAGSVPRRHRLS